MDSAREAAFMAVWAAYREEAYVSDSLHAWEKSAQPTKKDLKLAWEIAHGTVRMKLALDYAAKQYAERSRLNIKTKERALLHTAMYQHIFMARIPLYAIVNESVAIARKHCHSTFAAFLNALLRKLDKIEFPDIFPKDDTMEALSIRFSYPPFYVKELMQDYGLNAAKSILEIQNRPPQPMARLRDQNQVVPIDTNEIPQLAKRNDLYLQNITPAHLIWQLSEGQNPKTILDLCASPGGKLLALHDRFPNADLSANDISEEKLTRLKENCSKYNLTVSLSCGPGEEFQSGKLYDLVVLDVPCSNTGVLNKRPEARWRLSEKQLQELESTQLRLLEHARHLIAPKGEIWFMTCSILKRENENLIAKACMLFGYTVRKQLVVLPNSEGWEGGYAAALR